MTPPHPTGEGVQVSSWFLKHLAGLRASFPGSQVPPSPPSQLLRKRHIGNDIVTVIFQEPGALPFTPQNIRSHFQHVFVIVCAQSPCTESVRYR